jgi:hypothetical protein
MFLKDDIKDFKQQIKNAQSKAFKDYAEGRLKEAQWILANVGAQDSTH